MALVKPFLRVLLCLVKKLTVTGTIGKTQGVSSANKPPTGEARNLHSGVGCWYYCLPNVVVNVVALVSGGVCCWGGAYGKGLVCGGQAFTSSQTIK